ncbi:FimD/PapC C-terminal domain-containing protein, partial [Klebsiella grimontii]
ENRVALNTNTLANNVDLDDAVVSIVPTHGAIARAEFKASVGMKLLMTLTHNGKPVPFGAIAAAVDSQNSSIVADNGQVYLSGMPMAGKVRAKWGDGPDASCEADYRLPPESQNQALSQLSAACR